MCSPVKENCFLLYSQPFWHYLESAQITQVKGWVSQDCPPLQTPITSPGLPYFCPTGYTSGVPNTPSSGLISCWNSWKNSGKHFTMSSLLQRIQLRKSQMEETHRARSVGRGMELPCPPRSEYITLSAPCVHQPRSSVHSFGLVLLLLFFSAGSNGPLYRHDWMTSLAIGD